MDPMFYIKHMEKFGLMKPALPSASELALYFGKDAGEVTNFLTSLGYKTETVGENKRDMSAEVADICHYRIEPGKFSLILFPDILPFIKNKGMVSIMLYRVMNGLKSGGLALVNFFGHNSYLSNRGDMTFYDYDEVKDLVRSLSPKIVNQATFEGFIEEGKNNPLYRHTHIFVLQKSAKV